MQRLVRNHVPALTGILTIASVSVVFAAAAQEIPVERLPRAPDHVLAAIPDVNAGISVLAIVSILAGYHAIRRGNVQSHRRRMLFAFVLFVTFLALYLYRVALEGPTHFDGPEGIRTTVYLPLLAIHVTLAVICLPLLYYVLLLAYSHPVVEIPVTNHARVGRVAAVLWVTSFVLGIVVYLLLYVVY